MIYKYKEREAILEEIEYLDLVDANDNVIGKEDRNVIYFTGDYLL